MPVGFIRYKGACQRWCITQTQRALYTEAALEFAGMKESDDALHRDTSAAQVGRSETDVQSAIEAFSSFISPFDVQEPDLHCISSGMPAPSEVQGLTNALDNGSNAYKEFVQRSRDPSSNPKFHDSINKLKSPTFINAVVTKKETGSANKVVEISATRKFFGQLLNVSKNNEISLERIMGYCLSPVPWPLALPDGSLAHTAKAPLMHELQGNDAIPSPPHEATTIIDGNMTFYHIKKIPPTFGIAAREIVSKLPKSKELHFLTDSYHQNSIKNPERRRRDSDPVILKEAQTKTPAISWNSFLACGKNKEELIKFILME